MPSYVEKNLIVEIECSKRPGNEFVDSFIAVSHEDVKPPASLSNDISKRSDIVRLTCDSIEDLTDDEKHTRRIKVIRARVASYGLQESRRSSQTRSIDQLMTPPKGSSEISKEDKIDHFPLMCKLTQCIFCLGNGRKSYEGWTFEYAQPNKMIDEVKRHLKRFASGEPACKSSGTGSARGCGF